MRWRYSISSPVSSFKTAARTYLGKRRDMSAWANVDCWRMLKQDSIASCVVLNVLLRVCMAGPVGGYSACVRLRVCMVGPSSFSVGRSWARRRRRSQRAAFCSYLSARLALRAVKRVGRRCGVVVGGAAVLAAFRGLGYLHGGFPVRQWGLSVLFGGIRYWGPERVGVLAPTLETETPVGVSPLGGGSPLEARLG